MFSFLKNIFDQNKKYLNKYSKIVDKINDLEKDFKKLTDDQLRAKTDEFKQRIKQYIEKKSPKNKQELYQAEQEILKILLPEAFATVREVSRRVLGMRHFDVQLIAGIALHEGNITEQKTGEGKTLTVTAPLYLNALLGHGAHLVTVNDYLSEIGAGWMGPIYHFLGLSVGVLIHEKSEIYDPDFIGKVRGDERLEHFRVVSRKQAYLADITYGTNHEFGFDYLKDNMVKDLEKMVQRSDTPHFYAIVDEVDSILIDEARTPLIISAPDKTPTDKYYFFAKLVKTLIKGQDYEVDEKEKSATLTDLGVKRLERRLNVKNLYEEDYDTIHHIETALKALTLYQRDREYIVKDNKVIIVDEHTGRLMYGRRYSDGLHQAIEAKEGVPIKKESRTLATISIQNYFRMYSKLAGMSGTAATESQEFKEIYDCDVVVVPTNKPVIRKDYPDVIYKTQAAKYTAIVNEVEEIHKKGRPILIGTRSIEHNQIISKFLERKNIKANTLNAKNHEQEAFIIADAGKKGAITVATNIAGRGVDIVLGGAKPEIKDFRLDKPKENVDIDEVDFKKLGIPPSLDPKNYDIEKYAKALEQWKKAHDEVVKLGGLHIIGTERHESRRIDNQLRGRAGRQGDPGSSRFFISLEDDIMRIFGGDRISKMMDFLKIDPNQPIENALISKSIEAAQHKVEVFFFDQRKRLVQFDDVMNKQREVIYKRRRKILEDFEKIQEKLQELFELKQEKLSKDLNIDEKQIEEDFISENEDILFLLKDKILSYTEDYINELLYGIEDQDIKEQADSLSKSFSKILPLDDQSIEDLQKDIESKKTVEQVKNLLLEFIYDAYNRKEKELGVEIIRQFEKDLILSVIDKKWIDHLDAMDSLKEGIWLRGDKNTVLAEYRKEAFLMFEKFIKTIEENIVLKFFRSKVVVVKPTDLSDINLNNLDKSQQIDLSNLNQNLNLTQSNKSANNQVEKKQNANNTKSIEQLVKEAKYRLKHTGRNQKCPCGSGKKYKKCCYQKDKELVEKHFDD